MGKTERSVSALLLVLSLSMAGCSTVAPWERGNLAKPHMALETNPGQRVVRVHVYNSREAAAGGDSAGGGGCGCY